MVIGKGLEVMKEGGGFKSQLLAGDMCGFGRESEGTDEVGFFSVIRCADEEEAVVVKLIAGGTDNSGVELGVGGVDFKDVVEVEDVVVVWGERDDVGDAPLCGEVSQERNLVIHTTDDELGLV